MLELSSSTIKCCGMPVVSEPLPVACHHASLFKTWLPALKLPFADIDSPFGTTRLIRPQLAHMCSVRLLQVAWLA